MSIFSSLSYLLKKASFAYNDTKSTGLPSASVPEESTLSRNISRFVDEKSSTINHTSFDEYLHFLIGIGKFSNTTAITSSFNTSKIKLRNITSLGIPKTYFETDIVQTSESDGQFSNQTYDNADLLLESWWNVFDERYLRHGWGWTITLIIAYMLILVVGVIGNLMVILVVSLRPQMRTVTNMFIMNLAVADLFVVVFCVPSTLLANIFAPWILGSFLCKALAYVQGVAVCASAYSLAAISLDRCQAIYRNLERPRGFSRTTCITTVLIIWISAMSITIPWAIMFKVIVSEYDGLCYCVEIWDVETHGNIYFLVVNLSCFYAIPLLVIFASSWLIYFLVTHREVPQDSSVSSAPIRKMHRQTRHDVLKMLGIVTLTFLFSWLPLYILMIIIKFTESIDEAEYSVLGVLMPIAQWLGSWNSSMNPILYAFLNKKFRRMLKSILPSWIPVKANGQYQDPTRKPGFTANAYNERGSARSRNNNYKTTTQLISKYKEHTGKVVTITKKSSLTSSPTTTCFSSSLSTTFESAIAKRSTNGIITDL